MFLIVEIITDFLVIFGLFSNNAFKRVLSGYPDEFGHSIRRNLAGYSD
jgi:hypothetical protein